MSRYFNTIITDPAGKERAHWFSHDKDGYLKDGALRMELTASTTSLAFADTEGNTILKVYGLPLKEMFQQSNYTDCFIKVYGGMKKGLPFAKEEQAGLLVQGQIRPCYPQWEGVQQWLEFIIIGSANNAASDPKNLTFDWKKGQKLADALKQTLNEYPTKITIKDIVATANMWGMYLRYSGLAEFIKTHTLANVKDKGYKGVSIFYTLADGFTVTDYTTDSESSTSEFGVTDFIGQPTWLDVGTLQVKTIARGDVHVGDIVKLPDKMLVSATANAAIANVDRLSFKGKFRIVGINHKMDSRNPNGDSWVSIFRMNPY